MGESVGRGEEEEGEEEEERAPRPVTPWVAAAAVPASSIWPFRGWRDSSGFAAKPRLAKQARCRTAWWGRLPMARAPAASPPLRRAAIFGARRAQGLLKASQVLGGRVPHPPSSAGRRLLGYKGLGCDAARGTSVSVQCCASFAPLVAPRAARPGSVCGGRRAGASPHGRG